MNKTVSTAELDEARRLIARTHQSRSERHTVDLPIEMTAHACHSGSQAEWTVTEWSQTSFEPRGG